VRPTPASHPLDDADPLDWSLERAGASVQRTPPRWGARSRLALGLAATPRPSLILLSLGLALGPLGLGVLSNRALSALDPALSVALAALGIFVGLGLNVRHRREGALLAAASLEAAVTIGVVAGGMLGVQALTPADETTPLLLALMLGLCASASATTADTSPRQRYALAMRIGDLDDVLPIVLGAFLLLSGGFGTEPGPTGRGAVVVLASTAIAAAIAVGGWLLVGRTESDSEQRVFTIGTLLLLGGAAAYLAASALFAGLVAGVIWNVVGGAARERIVRDMGYLHHPLIVLLLLVAGARLQLSATLMGFAAVYLICRLAGKVAGGWMAGRMLARDVPRDMGLYLVSPGAVGIAFALNAAQAAGATDETSALLTVVVAGSLGSEVVSLLTPHPTEEAS
jgi:hypothetical protein